MTPVFEELLAMHAYHSALRRRLVVKLALYMDARGYVSSGRLEQLLIPVREVMDELFLEGIDAYEIIDEVEGFVDY